MLEWVRGHDLDYLLLSSFKKTERRIGVSGFACAADTYHCCSLIGRGVAEFEVE
jgi:hypothetical protein